MVLSDFNLLSSASIYPKKKYSTTGVVIGYLFSRELRIKFNSSAIFQLLVLYVDIRLSILTRICVA